MRLKDMQHIWQNTPPGRTVSSVVTYNSQEMLWYALSTSTDILYFSLEKDIKLNCSVETVLIIDV